MLHRRIPSIVLGHISIEVVLPPQTPRHLITSSSAVIVFFLASNHLKVPPELRGVLNQVVSLPDLVLQVDYVLRELVLDGVHLLQLLVHLLVLRLHLFGLRCPLLKHILHLTQLGFEHLLGLVTLSLSFRVQ